MSILANTSIKNRLTLIIITISAISVLLTVISIVAYSYYNIKQEMIIDLDLNAKAIGERNSAAISLGTDTMGFDDTYSQQAAKSLRFFKTNKSILKVCLYNAYKDEFAKYIADNVSDKACPKVGVYSVAAFTSKTLNLEREINYAGDNIGYIYIQTDKYKLDNFIAKTLTTAAIVMLVALIASYFLALYLQRSISNPILGIVRTADKVGAERDYSLRATQIYDDKQTHNNELAKLIKSFNKMLSEIESREGEMVHKNVQLEEAKNMAEKANEAKTQFLANISHELRTPLNSIIGFSDIICTEMLGPIENDKYSEYAHNINDSGVHLLEIINDILDISKAESGKLELRIGKVVLSKALDECLNIIERRAFDNNIKVTHNLPDNLPIIFVDRVRFKQIVLNILSNAVKFTEPEGEVILDVEHLEKDNQIRIDITDTGIGMSEDDIDKAFQSFVQIDGGLNRRHEGTGLGLPLTKQLVKLHKGRINVDSTPNKGTTVSVYLPVRSDELVNE